MLSAAAVTVVSLSVTASSPRLEMSPATPALNAVVALAVEPVTVVTEPASIVPEVQPLSVLRSAAATVVSVKVTASSPSPM